MLIHDHRPSSFMLQWHINDVCNYRCKHCYQESYSDPGLDYPSLLRILDSFQELLELWNVPGEFSSVRGHVTLTGGEPFLFPYVFELLQEFFRRRKYFSFSILSNGSLINRDVAKRLQTLGPRYIQISIEGSRETHDSVRGNGTYEQAITAIRNLVREDITTSISFTAHKQNYREFPDVVHLGRKLGISRVWADRLIPAGNGTELEPLTKEETYEFFKIMKASSLQFKRTLFSKTEVAMHRALQFLVGGDSIYRCTAGDSLITILSNGDLLPCRRMPIKVGNVLEISLRELYFHSPLLLRLRNPFEVSEECIGCSVATACRGGLRCLSYAMTGDLFGADPGCWLVPNEQPVTYECI